MQHHSCGQHHWLSLVHEALLIATGFLFLLRLPFEVIIFDSFLVRFRHDYFEFDILSLHYLVTSFLGCFLDFVASLLRWLDFIFSLIDSFALRQ